MTKIALAVLTASLVAATFTASDNAFAATKKKVSFEQAWKLCKAELDKDKIPTTTGSNMNERYIRGGACMKKYGYDL
jgi:hypothetical protein